MAPAAPYGGRPRRRFYRSELTVSDSGSRRSLLGVLMSVLVLLVISSVIVAAIFIVNPEIANFSSQMYSFREPVTLEEAMLGELTPVHFDAKWLAGGANRADEALLYEDLKNINSMSMPSGAALAALHQRHEEAASKQARDQDLSQAFAGARITQLVSNSSLLAAVEYQGYKLSPSRRYLLILTARRRQFRHSFTAKYFIYDIESDLISMISTRATWPGANGSAPGQQLSYFEQLDSASQYLNQYRESSERARFQHADWFDAAGQDSLILVQNNDIYLMQAASAPQPQPQPQSQQQPQQQQPQQPIRLTFTGKLNEIYNGVPDWLYEEEILTGTPALEVSPRGSTLAYMSFNDSQVDTMPYTIYGAGDQVIPRVQRIRYPKAGRANPQVSVHLVELGAASLGAQTEAQAQARAHIRLELPDELAGQQHYIARIKWLTNDHLALLWLNRDQNEARHLVCARQAGWHCAENYRARSQGGWLDIGDDLYPLDERRYLALLYKHEGDEVGAFKHIAVLALDAGAQQRAAFVTAGRKEVTQINGISQDRATVYFTATVEDEPGQRQVYAAYLGAASAQETAKFAEACLTCDHYPDECLYNEARMSPSTSFYIFDCDGPGIPRVELRLTPRAPFGSLAEQAASTAARPPERSLAGMIAAPELAPATAAGWAPSPVAGWGPASELGAPLADTGPLASGVAQTKSSQQPAAITLLVAPTDGSWRRRAARTRRGAPANRAARSLAGAPPHPNATAPAPPNQAAPQASKTSSPASAARSRPFGRSLGQPSPATPTAGPPTSAASNDRTNLLWLIEDNRLLRDRIKLGKALPVKLRLKVPIPNSNYSANVLMLLPPPRAGPEPAGPNRRPPRSNIRMGRSSAPDPAHKQATSAADLHSHLTLDTIDDYIRRLPSGRAQFPMLVDVYAGPGSQKVNYHFHVNFGYHMASAKQTVYVMIDGRGSGFEGTNRLYEIYRKFGTVEIQDQIQVADYLRQKFSSFINPKKVAIWGWSYGGYAAAMALAQSNARREQLLQARLSDGLAFEMGPPPPPLGRPCSGNSLNAYNSDSNATQTNQADPSAQQTTQSLKAKTLLPLVNAAEPMRLANVASSGPFEQARPSFMDRHDVFECAVSVAPVTNWIYYDTAYTERYMSSPYLNDQYDLSRPGDHNANLKFASSEARLPFSLPAGLSTTSHDNEWLPLNKTFAANRFIMSYEQANTQRRIISALRASRQFNSTSSAASQRNQIPQLNSGATSTRNPSTERECCGPDLNERYCRASLLEQAANINHKRFLLIHGTADDNVHFQQSAILMKRLIQKSVLFETRLYPDQDHEIGNKADRLHLGLTLSNFFDECFEMAE